MIQASDGDDTLSESEIVVNTLLIYAAGFETTTHLLGNTVRQLVDHPDQHQLLREDRSLVPRSRRSSGSIRRSSWMVVTCSKTRDCRPVDPGWFSDDGVDRSGQP